MYIHRSMYRCTDTACTVQSMYKICTNMCTSMYSPYKVCTNMYKVCTRYCMYKVCTKQIQYGQYLQSMHKYVCTKHSVLWHLKVSNRGGMAHFRFGSKRLQVGLYLYCSYSFPFTVSDLQYISWNSYREKTRVPDLCSSYRLTFRPTVLIEKRPD